MAKKNLKEQLSDVLEIKIQLLNLIYIFTEEVSVNVYHAHITELTSKGHL